jgi:hypothetical protein
MVRCARCGRDWLPELEAGSEATPAKPPAAPPDPEPARPEPADVIPPLPEITAMDRLAAGSAPPPPSGGLIFAWVLTFVVLAGAVVATVAWRDTVVRAWPASGRILPAIGHTAAPATQSAGKKAE